METESQPKKLFVKLNFSCEIPSIILISVIVIQGFSESECDIGIDIPSISSDTLGMSIPMSHSLLKNLV